jgi:crotonobetainyl-CoA:carnitine CoA-transferase CaiB-like acyl-CoA transferase
MAGPLSGIRIVDLTSVISGPLATSLLGDQGADVIKVEALTGDSLRLAGNQRGGVSSMFAALNRSKRAVAVNVREPEGRDLVLKLAADADVVIQNYRPGVVERLGLGPTDLRAVNPRLVYASINGVGADGPYAGRRIYDPVIQAMTGYAAGQTDASTGAPDLIRMMVCDKITALSAAQAVTAALLHRERTGEGQDVEIAMLEACLWFVWPDRMAGSSFVGDVDVVGADLASSYRLWPTADGHIAIIAIQMQEMHALFRAVGREDLIEDPRCADLPTLYQNFADLRALLEEATRGFATADLAPRLADHDVPFGIVLEGEDILLDEQVRHREAVLEYEHPAGGSMRGARPPQRFSGSPAAMARPAPMPGEHTDEILASIGIAEEVRADLRGRGVIG